MSIEQSFKLTTRQTCWLFAVVAVILCSIPVLVY